MNAVMWRLVSPIAWRIRSNDPSLVHVGPEFPGAQLLNPITYGHVAAPHAPPFEHFVTVLVDGDAIVQSALVVLVRENDEMDPFEGLFSLGKVRPEDRRIDRLLARWRHMSKQVRLNALPHGCAAFHGVELAPIPANPFPAVDSNGLRGFVGTWVVDGALTLDQVRSASALPLDFEPPLFDTLLLDAGAAWATGDYRKAILFSALAMEGAAKEALGEAYERALATRPPGLHVIDVPTKSGTTRKDPVYEALCEGTKFDRLTHERPLYLLGRSMQLEDADLYRLSKRLYETRNKLAHGVEPGEEQTNALPLTAEGAELAIDCAIRFLAWFGKGGGYHRPRLGHVEMRAFVEL